MPTTSRQTRESARLAPIWERGSTKLAEVARPEGIYTVLGNLTILRRDLALILNSRQSKTPLGSDDWVRNTLAAMRDAVAEGFPLIASIGMNTWELVLWAIGDLGGGAAIICPMPRDGSPEESAARIAEDFGLNPENHAWMFVPVAREARSGKVWWECRDRLAFDLATRIVPVSIRPKGRWEEWLGTRQTAEQQIDERFRVPYAGRSGSRTKIERPVACFSCEKWDYLTHWTRRCYGPWPGERSADYYRDVVSSVSGYARSASRTLARILGEERLRGSGERIRKGRPAIAFTALSPSEALPLMRWRKRYVRPTFEPYGIAIRRRAAIDLGIRQVTYVESGQAAGSIEPELTQGYGAGDWPAEAEWRVLGDIDLARFREEDAVVLVPSAAEAERFRSLTRFRVQALSEPFDSIDLASARPYNQILSVPE